MNCTQEDECFRHFKYGRKTSILMNVLQDTRPPGQKNIAYVCAPLKGNSRSNIRELLEDVHINCGSIQSFVTEDIAMRPVFAEFVPKSLSVDQNDVQCFIQFHKFFLILSNTMKIFWKHCLGLWASKTKLLANADLHSLQTFSITFNTTITHVPTKHRCKWSRTLKLSSQTQQISRLISDKWFNFT